MIVDNYGINTDSATACFTAVQELKKEINNERSDLRNY